LASIQHELLAMKRTDEELMSLLSRFSELRRKFFNDQHRIIVHDIDTATLEPAPLTPNSHTTSRSTAHAAVSGSTTVAFGDAASSCAAVVASGATQDMDTGTNKDRGEETVWLTPSEAKEFGRKWRTADAENLRHKFLWFRRLCEARWSVGHEKPSGYYYPSIDGQRRLYDERTYRWLRPLTRENIDRREQQSRTRFPTFYKVFLMVCGGLPNHCESWLQLTDWHSDIGPETERDHAAERKTLSDATVAAIKCVGISEISPVIPIIFGYCRIVARCEVDAYGHHRSLRQRLLDAARELRPLNTDNLPPFLPVAMSPLHHYYICGATMERQEGSATDCPHRDDYRLDGRAPESQHRDDYRLDGDDPECYSDIDLEWPETLVRGVTAGGGGQIADADAAGDLPATPCEHVFVVRRDCPRGRTDWHPCSVAPTMQSFLLRYFTDFAHRTRAFTSAADYRPSWAPIQDPAQCAFPLLYQKTPVSSSFVFSRPTLPSPPVWLCA
jgi:hypothetical protein